MPTQKTRKKLVQTVRTKSVYTFENTNNIDLVEKSNINANNLPFYNNVGLEGPSFIDTYKKQTLF